jgi:hypothetical protein
MRQVTAQLYALVSSTVLGALHLDQATSTGCWQTAVAAFNITQSSYSVDR